MSSRRTTGSIPYIPGEISEPHLRMDMDLEAPMPLTSELQAEGMAMNKPH